MYFGALGAVTLIFGGLQIVTNIWGTELSSGPLQVPQDIWSGLILFFAGAFMMAGAAGFADIHGLAKVVLGCIMLWIVAGSEILTRLMTPIFGEEGWINAPNGFLSIFETPYAPALFLLPFSLLVIYYIRSRR